MCEKDVLTSEESRALLEQLSVKDRAMVFLIGNTGVRRSELLALIWTDVDIETVEVSITRSCVRSRFGDTKTECFPRPVPLHPLILESLLDWRRESLYRGDRISYFHRAIENAGAKIGHVLPRER
jgi:integrase